MLILLILLTFNYSLGDNCDIFDKEKIDMNSLNLSTIVGPYIGN